MVKDPCLINQITVILKNQPGSLAILTRHVANKEIDLHALCLAETREFGVARLIVDDPETCKAALNEMNYNFVEADVLAVVVEDIPGGIAFVLETIADRNLNVDYLYPMTKNRGSSAVIIISVSSPVDVIKALRARGVTLLTMKDLASL
jgi:hypothetical protein